jgi:hypothetical protein
MINYSREEGAELLAVYLVGSHPNSPTNPHHAGASGGNNIGDIRNDPPTNLHVLYGAMVGGPIANDRFWDWRDDWVQTEVALDYNAMIPTLASMMVRWFSLIFCFIEETGDLLHQRVGNDAEYLAIWTVSLGKLGKGCVPDSRFRTF